MAGLDETKPQPPTLEDVINLRDDISALFEGHPPEDANDEKAVQVINFAIRLGYIIAAALVSISESMLVVADEADQTMQEAEERKPDPMDTL